VASRIVELEGHIIDSKILERWVGLVMILSSGFEMRVTME